MASTAGRAASFVRDGVVYSSSAIVNGVNAITPHLAGAVDILVVRQPDGTLKSTPFYVRFGKYSSFRSKDRTVRICVNGTDSGLRMHLGSYGQAYFIMEASELFTGDDDEGVDYAGGMSSPSGYSSNDEDDDEAPYASRKELEAVQNEVQKLQLRNDRSTSEGAIPCSYHPSSAESSTGEAGIQLGVDAVEISEGCERSSFAEARSHLARRVYSLENHGGDGNAAAPCHRQSSHVLSTLPSSRSCPSFKTTIDLIDDEHEDFAPDSEHTHSQGALEKDYSRDIDFYSPEASLKYRDTSKLPHDGELRQVIDLPAVLDNDRGDTDTNELPVESVSNRLEISLCHHLLERDMSPRMAQQIFEAHRIDREMFAAKGVSILADERLMCRWNGVLYPWKEAAPRVVGALAFGGRWEDVLEQRHRLDPASSSNCKTDEEFSKATSGWYLWPFGGLMTKEEDVQKQPRLKKPTKKFLSPTPEQLAMLELSNGQNVISYRLGDNVLQEAYLYVINWSSRLVISDIDGTVTRSDLLGHLLPPIGVDWTHSGVAHLFSDITANGYEIMFLSSRAIAQANHTRDFLHRLEQEGIRMPVGPVIISPHGLLPSLYREMILRRPHDFKIGCLQDVRRLFPEDWNPFYAGFGNRETDVISYEESGVPPSRIFTINPRGQIIRGASTSIQTSTWSSLHGINEMVHDVFPCYAQGDTTEMQREEYNEFQHWRVHDYMFFEQDPKSTERIPSTSLKRSS